MHLCVYFLIKLAYLIFDTSFEVKQCGYLPSYYLLDKLHMLYKYMNIKPSHLYSSVTYSKNIDPDTKNTIKQS